MAAYRLDGGRLYYVEHECVGARGDRPNARHVIENRVHNKKYVVRMFYTGDMSATRASASQFAYMTDGVAGAGGTDAYVNCPLCGSEGRISLDANNLIDIREAFDRTAMTESPFR
jgi:hypothetical protein